MGMFLIGSNPIKMSSVVITLSLPPLGVSLDKDPIRIHHFEPNWPIQGLRLGHSPSSSSPVKILHFFIYTVGSSSSSSFNCTMKKTN
jgi:hypothetical protein